MINLLYLFAVYYLKLFKGVITFTTNISCKVTFGLYYSVKMKLLLLYTVMNDYEQVTHVFYHQFRKTQLQGFYPKNRVKSHFIIKKATV